MINREKVIRHIVAEISIARTCKKDFASVDIDMLSDALTLLKEQNEVIDALLKVGYPHNFQREEPWIVNYMYAITDVIKQAVHLRNGGD